MEQEFGYAKLDQPGVLQYLFHPRQEAASNPPPGAIDHDIQVDEDISVGARFHLAEQHAASELPRGVRVRTRSPDPGLPQGAPR